MPLPRALALGWLVAFIACLLAFTAIAAHALGPEPPPLDRSISDQFHDLANRALDAFMLSITSLGSTPTLAILVGLVMLGLVVRGRRVEALFAAAALGASLALNEGLKRLLERPRPALDWAEAATGFGFPSGHAMNSTVVLCGIALIVWRLRGPRAGAVALALSSALVLLVGSSRIYLGVHWMTDVVGGFSAGALVLLILLAAFSLVGARPWVGQPGRS